MSLNPASNNALQKLGRVPAPEHRSVLISVPGLDACAVLGTVLADIRHHQDRVSFLFLPGAPEVRDWIEARFPGSVLQAPWNNRFSASSFLVSSRARMLLAIGHLDAVPLQLVRSASSLHLPIAVVYAQAPVAGHHAVATAPLVDWWHTRNSEATARLKGLGVPESRIAEARAGGVDEDGLWQPLRTLMAWRPVNPRLRERLIAAAVEHPLWQRLVSLRAQRIETLADLQAALGHPKTILCLGNGPSSEEPAVLEAKYDALFRANHRWLERGLLCKPDMVFTGQKRALSKVRGALFAFRTVRTEGKLVGSQVFNPLRPRMRYVTLERLGVLGDFDWQGLRPTKGATMIATAVALKPRRLIVAGIDMFSDPNGAYPGDDMTPNAYVLVHDADLERRFIMETLERYDGELVIRGKVLAEHWRVHKKSRQPERAAS